MSTSRLELHSKTYMPFHYPWAVEITKVHENVHWIEEEVDLSDDVNDWKGGKMSDGDKAFVHQILKLFTQSDVEVARNYLNVYIPKFKNNEIRSMLSSFAGREFLHQRAYALLNTTLGFPDSDFELFLEYKEMINKVEFMTKIDPDTVSGLGLALAKTVFNEGVSLFAQFAMLLNYQRFGKMKGMGTVNLWSIRDETIHYEGMTELFRAYCSEHPRIVTDEFKTHIYQMARDVVKLEDKFIELVYKEHSPEGLTEEEVKRYVRYITDRRLIQLGLKGNFKVKDNPIPWIDELIAGVELTNFFENRVTNYAVVGLTGEDWGWPDE